MVVVLLFTALFYCDCNNNRNTHKTSKIAALPAETDPEVYKFYFEAIASDPEKDDEWMHSIALLKKAISIDFVLGSVWTSSGDPCLEYSGQG